LDSIYQLADEGKLQAAVMTDGSIGISQISVNNLLPKEALTEYQLNAGLKGVPISMNAALIARGTAVGILADSLEKSIRNPEKRAANSRGDLCLASPYSPSAPFSVGTAMG